MSRSSAPSAVLVAAFVLNLAGCATSGSTASVAPAAAPVASGDRIEQDSAYVQRVEQIAKRRGIGVTWVNPPVKRRVATR